MLSKIKREGIISFKKQKRTPYYLGVLAVTLLGGLLLMLSHVDAADYSFSVDSFQVTGNLPVNLVDDFDDGVVAPWWIHDPTVVESGGMVTFSTPGTIEQNSFNGITIVNELSNIGSRGISTFFDVQNGAGDFTGLSRWVATVPGENQFYGMGVAYELQQEPHKGVGIHLDVTNWDTVFANLLGIPEGLSITFQRTGGIPTSDFIWQGIPISESDITGDILLSMNFDDTNDQFTADFSLDGGATFQSPFAPLDWGMETPGKYGWHLSGQSLTIVPEPISSTLFIVGGATLGLRRFRKKRITA
jgi:hypothetical protein